MQDDAPAATIHLGDGTSVALVSWKLSYEFATWKAKEPVSSAKTQARAGWIKYWRRWRAMPCRVPA